MEKVFVMGGGSFRIEPENLLFDQYILKLSDRLRPKICFIGTASGDNESYIEAFYTAYRKFDCEPNHLSLFKPQTRDLAGFISEQHIVYVGGGNTKNLLSIWRDWGLDEILMNAYKAGLILTGISAGMICWFEETISDSFGGIDPMKCLGLLKGSASAHFNLGPERRLKFPELIKSGEFSGGIALDDGVGALYINGKLNECVSSRKDAGAYNFSSKTAIEEKLPVRYLGF